MSTQETELPDCQEKVGLKRKPTGPPRLLLGKSKSREKADSQRRLRRDKCCEDTPENIDKQQDSHHSPQKASETEEMKTQHDAQGDTILVTLEESQGKEENDENKTGMTRSTSKTTIKRTFSSLLCSGRRRKESETQHNSNAQETKKSSPRNKAQTNMHENKLCDANYEAVAQEKGKRIFFFMVWPISKRSSSDVIQGRRCREQGSRMLLQETPPKDSFKKIYRIFRRRKKAHPPDNHNECGASKTTHIEVAGDQLNQLSTDNMEIPSTPKQDHLKKEQDIEKRASETFTFSAEVSVNKNIESGHIDNDQEEDQIVLSTTKEEKHTVLESTNEILQTSDLLNSCCFDSGLLGTSNASRDAQAINDAHQKESDKNYIKCRPVITIDRVYTPEEENQENEASHFDFLSMNGSWQYLQINSLTNNTLHPSDMSSSAELDPGRCNETLLIQTAISMVQTAIRGAVELLANEQQQNQISLDSV